VSDTRPPNSQYEPSMNNSEKASSKNSGILKDLNPEQLKAVTTTNGPLLIIAGAGTGKTTVIARRIAYIIEKNLAKPSDILALTFTDKSAAEMEERVDVLVPYGFIDTWISTFHAFGERVLKENPLDAHLTPDFKVFSRPQQVLFFQQNLFRFNLDYFRPLGNPTRYISAIVSFFSRLKDENVSPEEFLKFANIQRQKANSETLVEADKYLELAHCYESYEKYKDEAGFLDFGDLVVKTIKLFQTRPQILASYQQRFKYILVDEYQDTNYSQNILVNLLASAHKNICVVGDDDQCLPSGTLIDTPSGKKKIEKIKEGERVMTAVGRGHVSISTINKVFKNKKNARLLTIKTMSGRIITLTDNHKVFCYVPSRVINKKYYYVYLMNRQNLGWRIGITNDLATRLRLEVSADRIIALRAFKTAEEARYYEMLYALKYGIPPGVFKDRQGTVIKGDLLAKLYKDLGNEAGILNIAEDFGIDLNSPHHTLGAVTRGQSNRIKINLELCARNYKSKTAGVLQNPLISHTINLQTSNPEIIKKLQGEGFVLNKAKKGLRLRIQSNDIVELGKIAERLKDVTSGLIEAKFSLGVANFQSRPALVMPASNLVLGHYLPIVKGDKIYYDEIVEITERNQTLNVYDLEIDKTHNFIANGIVVHNSIYKFRGAAISNILEFNKTYPKADQVVLTENYRSTQTILDSAYKLITHNNPDRLEVQNKIDKKLRSRKGVGHPPQEIFTETISEEADAVADQIEKHISKNRKKSTSHAPRATSYSYKDFAILVRANSQADNFLRALNMHGIPHKFVGSSGLYEQPEVSLIISFLTAISNVEDSLNLFNLLTSEIYQTPPLEAIKLNSYASRKNRSLFYVLKNLGNLPEEELEISNEAKAILEKVMEDLDAAINLSKDQPAGKVIYDFLKRTNYLEKLERVGGIDSQIKIQNIAKFFDKVKEFQDIAKVESVMQFVDYLTSLRDAGDDPATIEFDPDLDAVNVMTVHGAKGLEFPVVFMVNLVSDRFPSRHRKDAIELPETLITETLPAGDWHIQEERRLFYVGMTRAKDILYFSWSRDVGGARAKKASPFVLEALDKPGLELQTVKLSPKEKIERFAPIPPRVTQTVMFDVDVLKLTQGSIDDYLTCAYKYRYIHLLRIPILRHHSIAYGAALHNAIAAFLNSKKQGKLLSLPQFLEVFENVWDSEGFLTHEHEQKRKAQGKLALEKFWERETKSKEIPSLVETGFKFVINETTIVGRFDRVDVKPGGKIEIIDYKSSENIDQERANSQAKESIQLGIYALYYWKKHNMIPEKVTLHFLETGVEGSYTPTQKDLDKVENLITETAQSILRDTKTNLFTAKPKYFGSVPACNYCAYNSICPFSLAKI